MDNYKKLEFRLPEFAKEFTTVIQNFELAGIAYTLSTDGFTVTVTITGA